MLPYTDSQIRTNMKLYGNDIFSDKIFYHIYPLGMGNCPKENNFTQSAGNFFEILETDLDRIRRLGCNAIYLGPIFESTRHGYDTLDYYHIDRRLGNNESFKKFCDTAHEMGFAIVLDAVFNHTGRDFFAFRDLIAKGQDSQYRDWYQGLNFSSRSNYGDSFDYDGWAGCKDLVKLNLRNRDVRNHILGAVSFWMDFFKIDGLRLDAADVMDKDFFEELGKFCRERKNDFWLMGEVVHGDYNEWCNPKRIDSVTNYQLYKAIFSSVDSRNFFELSYNLNRESGNDGGMYRYAPLYNFLDNHDINRVASEIQNPEKELYMIYGLLFSIPGIPSIYYGSEFALKGTRTQYGDQDLRPSIPPFTDFPEHLKQPFDVSFLSNAISVFSEIRKNSPSLQKGSYRELHVENQIFAFERIYEENEINERIVIICSTKSDPCSLNLDFIPEGTYTELISGTEHSLYGLKNFKLNPFDIVLLKAAR